MPPPRKKDRLRAVCPRCRNNFRPQGRSVAVKLDCRAKAARTRAQKQSRAGGLHLMGGRWAMGVSGAGKVPHWAARRSRGYAWAQNSPRRGPGAVCRLRPWGKGSNGRYLVAESDLTGCPPGQRAYPAQKQPPAEAGSCAQTAPMGERRTSCAGWCLESTALGTRQGRGHARAQKQPPAEAGSCAQTAPMGERQAMGVSGAGKAPHWAPAGAEGTPGRKTAPGGGPEAVWMRDMDVTCPGRSV